MALLACVVGCTVVGTAQDERPQITPGERKPAKKKEVGPRALGVVQLAASGKASLVPIAILINGKFWDATAYKADPVPMALESGTVYEGERAGNSLGLFTVGSALHSNAANAPTPWIGTGVWRPVGMEPPTKPMKAENTPVGIDNEDAPPRLTRDPGKQPASGAPSSGGAPASTSAPPSSTPQSSAPQSTGSSSSDGPPRLTKGTSPASAPPESSTPAGQSQPDPGASPASTSSGQKPTDTKADDRAKIPASDSGAGDANRPKLRRGKPAESFADEDIPGYSKPGSSPASSAGAGAKIVEATAASGDVQIVPAISDAAGPLPRSFTFEWLKGEEGDRRKQMMDMAKDQLRAYVVARAKAKITPAPARPVPVRHTTKPVEPIFENVQMVGYDLWNSNQAVIIFSAEAHMPPPPAGTPHSEVEAELRYSVLLVAYPDIYNNLHKLYSGVTDKFHLDVTPRLELIDAVDADGDGRGELLFRKTTDGGSGWVVYRATADKLWKMFDSMNPE
jgi:hypothetical protein